MKIFFLCLLVGILYAAPIDKTIDELLDNEAKAELKIPLYDPFKRAQPLLKKKSKPRKSHFSAPAQLSAIMNDKAFFAGRWYKLGDNTPEGKLVKLRKDKIYLRQGKKTKVLKLQKKKPMFKIHEKASK
ncbi:MAG: hypothetical protein COA44_12065 [Arcobacter sp.]|nr:MAG: hypothetical protein COA44_12065 [Arcobacter sp.]